MRVLVTLGITALALSVLAQSPEAPAESSANDQTQTPVSTAPATPPTATAPAPPTVTPPPVASIPSAPKPAPPEAYDSDTLIHSDVRRVLLDVSVRDPKGGGYVSGLQKDNFHVFEDGKPQPIVEFAAGDIPVTVGLLVDESLSMRPKRAEVLTAAMSFIHESNPADEMFVLNFNETVRHGLPDTVLFSGNINQLRNALFAGQPQGRTALYDAVFDGLKQLEMGRQAKKTLVLISDGGDNVSKHHLPDIVRLAEETSATIYTVGIFDEDDHDKNPGILNKLAHISGGVAYYPQDTQKMIPTCEQIAKDIRNRYTLSYIPAPGARQLRHIKVEVRNASGLKLDARTRTVYLFQPDTESAQAKTK
jgi:VWFA-related protein